jgi:hypothetical protein
MSKKKHKQPKIRPAADNRPKGIVMGLPSAPEVIEMRSKGMFCPDFAIQFSKDGEGKFVTFDYPSGKVEVAPIFFELTPETDNIENLKIIGETLIKIAAAAAVEEAKASMVNNFKKEFTA